MLHKEEALKIEIRKTQKGSTYKVFHFECSECKDSIKAQSNQLSRHSGKCRKCTQKKRPYEHIINELIYSCTTKRITDISLDYDQFLEIIHDSKCHYCDKILIFNPYTRDGNSNYVSRAYQLDRKDNNKGYHIDNVVPCCWECNRIKSDKYNYIEFLKIGKTLSEIRICDINI